MPRLAARYPLVVGAAVGVGLGVSLGLMIVASFGYISPAAGAVMQEALDAGVILNALRVR